MEQTLKYHCILFCWILRHLFPLKIYLHGTKWHLSFGCYCCHLSLSLSCLVPMEEAVVTFSRLLHGCERDHPSQRKKGSFLDLYLLLLSSYPSQVAFGGDPPPAWTNQHLSPSGLFISPEGGHEEEGEGATRTRNSDEILVQIWRFRIEIWILSPIFYHSYLHKFL